MGGTNLSKIFNSVEIYDPAADTWSTGTPMPAARSKHTSTLVNGKFYVIGGLGASGSKVNTVWEYDPVADTWASKGNMPKTLSGHVSVVDGGYIFVFVDDGTTVYIYEVAADEWWYGTSMPNAYIGRTASAVNGKIYAIGGLSSMKFRSTCLEYDLSKPYGSSDAWTYKSSMAAGRTRLTSAVVGGKIYAIGGYNYNSYQRTVEEYDPAINTWTTKYSMSTSRESLSSAVVNGKIYVIGGRKGNDVLATVEEYDPANDN
jgi:N-acetylneuraminic acid mutarotase